MATPGEEPPEVNEHFPDFEFSQLAVSPPEWELYDVPDKTHLRNRAFDLRTFKQLLKHHAWGINVVIGERKTKERVLHVLKTIIFNHQPNLRPSWHEFVSRDCDAGPRLLRRSYNALQISRNHPRGIPGQPLQLPPLPGTQPLLMGPPNNVHTANSMGFPCSPAATPNSAPTAFPNARHGSVPSIQQGYPLDTVQNSCVHVSPQATDGCFVQHDQPPAQPRRNIQASANPAQDWGSNRQSQFQTPVAIQSRRELPRVDSTAPESLAEVIERAVIKFTYRSLDRHPKFSQHSPTGIAYSRATSSEDIRGFSQVSHVQLTVSDDLLAFQFDPKGKVYPYRGQGPVSTNNISDAIDCVIVSGILANAGSTLADGVEDRNWGQNLSVFARAYLNTINSNWDITSDNDNSKRGETLRNVLAEYLASKRPLLASLTSNPTNVWKLCTRGFSQFRIQFTDTRYPCRCLKVSAQTSTTTSTCITPTPHAGDLQGVDISLVLGRFFKRFRYFNCSNCRTRSSNRVERLFRALPLRLAVQPDPRVILRNHTSSYITVTYADAEGRELKAVYSWLGGIYHTMENSQHRFRVCWNDNERENGDNASLRLYDAAQASGVIFGGVKHGEYGERVPDSWSSEGYAPFLFYERVINPDPETLASARDAVLNMLNLTRNGNMVLQNLQERRVHQSDIRPTSQQQQTPGHQSPVPSGSMINDSFSRAQPSRILTEGSSQPPTQNNETLSSLDSFSFPFNAGQPAYNNGGIDTISSSLVATDAQSATSYEHLTIPQSSLENADPILAAMGSYGNDPQPQTPMPLLPTPGSELQQTTTSTTGMVPQVPNFGSFERLNWNNELSADPAYPAVPQQAGNVGFDAVGQDALTPAPMSNQFNPGPQVEQQVEAMIQENNPFYIPVQENTASNHVSNFSTSEQVPGSDRQYPNSQHLQQLPVATESFQVFDHVNEDPLASNLETNGPSITPGSATKAMPASSLEDDMAWLDRFGLETSLTANEESLIPVGQIGQPFANFPPSSDTEFQGGNQLGFDVGDGTINNPAIAMSKHGGSKRKHNLDNNYMGCSDASSKRPRN